MNNPFEPLIGKTLKAIGIDADAMYLRFETTEGNFTTTIDADCCSSSWFEEIKGIENVYGARVESVVEVNEIPGRTVRPAYVQEYEQEYYFLLNVTVKNQSKTILIVGRNESNGYYGGWVSTVAPENIIMGRGAVRYTNLSSDYVRKA